MDRAGIAFAIVAAEDALEPSPKERLHFLHVASGSLAEVGYCLHAARRLGYIDESTYRERELEIRKVAAPLNGLIRFQSRVTRESTSRRK